jgi:endonuclease/exonuclease/phosphatase family metal-dependent hydrolase
MNYLSVNLSGYASVGVGREDGKEKGEYAPVFYDSSRFELLLHTTFWLSEKETQVSVGWDAALERICTYCLFRDRFSGDSIHIFNTHFDHMGVLARKMSAGLIIRKIGELTQPDEQVILMGDLNCEPDSEPVQLLKRSLFDAAGSSGSSLTGPPGTFNGFNESALLNSRIDYILVRNIQVLSYQHIDKRMRNGNLLSDHLPVLVEFFW